MRTQVYEIAVKSCGLQLSKTPQKSFFQQMNTFFRHFEPAIVENLTAFYIYKIVVKSCALRRARDESQHLKMGCGGRETDRSSCELAAAGARRTEEREMYLERE